MHGGWSSLAPMVEKSDILEHYGDSHIPMQLRMLGEQMVVGPVDTMVF